MARYIGPKCKLSRRVGTDLLLKSRGRSLETKCKLDTPPGQHGARKPRLSDYALQLREKQKLKQMYGLLERQFHNYFVGAEHADGITGENLLRSLETRLDNVIFRLGFGTSRAQARQLVAHGHFAVNGVPTDVPSYRLKVGDKVEIRESRRSREAFKITRETLKSHTAPEWLSLDAANLAGSVLSLPRRDQMPLDLSVQLVVEYYSR
jgi:small subunit ribosomal protein S4